MPLYEYFCEVCGLIEVLQKLSDAPLTECPNCKKPVEKMISNTATPQFKGNGFYSTDYVKKKKT